LRKVRNNRSIEIISRIKDHYNIRSDVDFAEYLGIATTTLSSWKSRDSLDYDLIYAKCVGINANWLLSGCGEMMIKHHSDIETSSIKTEDNNKNKYISQLEDENKRLIADNKKKQETIDHLINSHSSAIISE
jgi:hypothetical protein